MKNLFQEHSEQLQGRNHQSRKLRSNTYLQRRCKDIAVLYHATDILLFHQDGSITINTNGWQTSTTKERLNDYLPGHLGIDQKNYVWYIRDTIEQKTYYYKDGAKISPSGRVVGCDEYNKEREKAQNKLRRRINTFAQNFAKQAISFKLPKPSGGDCWYCCMTTQNGNMLGEEVKDESHLLSHIKEKYYVPSLFWHIMTLNKDKMSRFDQHNLACIQNDMPDKASMLEYSEGNYQKFIAKYFRDNLLKS